MYEVGNEVVVNVASVGQPPILRQGRIISEPFGKDSWGVKVYDDNGTVFCYDNHRFLLIDADWELG